jgi:hypothetical protein
MDHCFSYFQTIWQLFWTFCKYKIYWHWRNRPVKLVKGSIFLQINFIFADSVAILFICPNNAVSRIAITVLKMAMLQRQLQVKKNRKSHFLTKTHGFHTTYLVFVHARKLLFRIFVAIACHSDKWQFFWLQMKKVTVVIFGTCIFRFVDDVTTNIHFIY